MGNVCTLRRLIMELLVAIDSLGITEGGDEDSKRERERERGEEEAGLPSRVHPIRVHGRLQSMKGRVGERK